MIIKDPELRKKLHELDVKMFMVRDAGNTHEHNCLVREYNGILKAEEDKQLCLDVPAPNPRARITVLDTCCAS